MTVAVERLSILHFPVRAISRDASSTPQYHRACPSRVVFENVGFSRYVKNNTSRLYPAAGSRCGLVNDHLTTSPSSLTTRASILISDRYRSCLCPRASNRPPAPPDWLLTSPSFLASCSLWPLQAEHGRRCCWHLSPSISPTLFT